MSGFQQRGLPENGQPGGILGSDQTASAIGDAGLESRGESMGDASLDYAAQGIAVFPLHHPLPDGRCSCGNAACGTSAGKHPRTYNGLKAATTDANQIRKWSTTWPGANIGVPTGAINGLVIIDVDRAEGEESLRRMTEKYGPLPATKKVKTGNGYQLYFKHPGGKVKSKAPLCAEFPHVDCRGDGGYVVAPPSLHYSGVRYTVDPAMPSILADLPSWLLDLINGDRKLQATQGPVAANDLIPDGSRNATLASLAGSMRARGMQQDAIEAALLVTNVQQCNPPLPDDEVRGIARSISSYPPGSPNDVLRTLTEKGNADRFAQRWGADVRYVPELGRWLIWTGTHWQPDTVGAVMEMAKQTALAIYGEGDLQTDSEIRKKIANHSKTSLQANKLEAMLKLARTMPELVVSIARLDADRWVLGVENGTLDLRDGTLLPVEREDYITKLAPVAFCPEAQCPLFLKFLDEVMGSDQKLVAYLQRVFGYMLTGDTSAQCLFFLYGTGANGKSTLLNIGKALLGSGLCRQTPSETIMVRKSGSGPTPELASLAGARAVMTTEVEDRSLLAESLIKLMTGGDPIPARHLYRDPFEYLPYFKLFIAGNHKPVILGDDLGIWRRIHLIPFLVTIAAASRDPRLLEKLCAELSGILNWALEGCQQFQESGLNPPPAIVDAVAEYKEEMDVLGLWLEECCNTGEALYTTAKHSFLCFNAWLTSNGFRPWNRTSFGRKVKERFKADRNAHGVVYWGFTLKNPFPIQEDGLSM